MRHSCLMAACLDGDREGNTQHLVCFNMLILRTMPSRSADNLTLCSIQTTMTLAGDMLSHSMVCLTWRTVSSTSCKINVQLLVA